MLGGLGMTELLLILGIVMLLFGAKRLPEIASGMGGAINSFKRSLREGKEEEAQATLPAGESEKVPEAEHKTTASEKS
ncbi:MAG: twin-arginine translocase TatA/TatE family subunit [Deltaproteobacteria bacterium]|nr:twin-arginine translocase TatA/TatE family subunit [Deltaproteobacteria bacterium]